MLSKSAAQNMIQLKEDMASIKADPPLKKYSDFVKFTIFDFLYMLPSRSISLVTFSLIWIIITLQHGWFLSEFFHSYQWKSRVSEVFISITSFLAYYPAAHNSIMPFWGAFAVAAFFPIVCLTAYLMKRSLSWDVPLFWVRFVVVWVPTVLFLPTMAALINMMFGCISSRAGAHHPFFDNVICWSRFHIGVSVSGLFLASVFLAFSIVVSLCFFDSTLPFHLNKAPDYSARLHNRPEVFGLIMKTVLLILFASGRTESWRVPMALIFVFYGCCSLYMQLTLMPYYNDYSQSLYLTTSLFISWIGAVMVSQSSLYDSPGNGMLFFAVLPLVFMGGFLLLRFRYFQLSTATTRECTSAVRVNLIIRSAFRHYFNYVHGRSGDSYIDMTSEEEEKRAEFMRAVDALITIGIHRFPDDSLIMIFAAIYHHEYHSNRLLCYSELIAAERSNHIDVLFLAYRTRKVIESEAKAGAIQDVVDYLEFKQRKETVEKDSIEVARVTVLFWTELMGKSPDLTALAEYAHIIRTTRRYIVNNFEALLRLNNTSIPVLRGYASFLADILFHPTRANELIKRAQDIEASVKLAIDEASMGPLLQVSDDQLDVFDDRLSVIEISLERTNIGEILSVNAATKRIFGYDGDSELIGHNINKLQPEPIAENHDQILTNFLSSKNEKLVGKTITIIGKTARGFIVPISANFRWSSESEGRIMCVIQALPYTYDVHIMVDFNTHAITYSTPNIIALLGVNRRELFARELHLSTILKGLKVSADEENQDDVDKAWSQLSSSSGLTCEVDHGLTDQTLVIHAWSTLLPVLHENVYLMRLNVSNKQEDSEHEMDTEVEHEDELEVTLRSIGIGAGLDTFPNTQLDTVFMPQQSMPSSQVPSPTPTHINKRSHTRNNSADAVSSHRRNISSGFIEAYSPHRGSFNFHQAHTATSEVREEDNVSPFQDLTHAPRLSMRLSSSSPMSGLNGVEQQQAHHVFHPIIQPLPRPPQPHVLLVETASASNTPAFRSRNLPINLTPHGHSAHSKASHRSAAAQVMVNSSRAHGPGQPTVDTPAKPPVIGKLKTITENNRTDELNNSIYKRLKRGVRNEERYLGGRLRLLSIFSFLIVFMIVAFSIVVEVIKVSFMAVAEENIHLMYSSGLRQALVSDIGITLNSFNLVKNYPPAAPVFYRPDVHASANWQDLRESFKQRVEDSLEVMKELTKIVDLAPTTSEKLTNLRNNPVLTVRHLYGKTITFDRVSLREAITHYSAMTTLAISPNAQATYYVLSNGLTSILEGLVLNSEYYHEAFNERLDLLHTISMIFLILSLVGMILLFWLLVIPIFIQVEQSKAKVLLLMDDVSIHTKKLLRKRAYAFYNVVKGSQDDDLRDIREEEEKEQQDKLKEVEASSHHYQHDNFLGSLRTSDHSIQIPISEGRSLMNNDSDTARSYSINHQPLPPPPVLPSLTEKTDQEGHTPVHTPPLSPLVHKSNHYQDTADTALFSLDSFAMPMPAPIISTSLNILPQHNHTQLARTARLSALFVPVNNSEPLRVPTQPRESLILNHHSLLGANNLGQMNNSGPYAQLELIPAANNLDGYGSGEDMTSPIVHISYSNSNQPHQPSPTSPFEASSRRVDPVLLNHAANTHGVVHENKAGSIHGDVERSSLSKPWMQSNPHISRYHTPEQTDADHVDAHGLLNSAKPWQQWQQGELELANLVPSEDALRTTLQEGNGIVVNVLDTNMVSFEDKLRDCEQMKIGFIMRGPLSVALFYRVIAILAMIAIYFGVTLVLSDKYGSDLVNSSHVMALSSRRVPWLMNAFMIMRMDILFSYDLMKTKFNPLNPTLVVGNYAEYGLKYTKLSQDLQTALLFGHSDQFNIHQQIDYEGQSKFMFNDLCNLDPNSVSEPLLSPMFFSSCNYFREGILRAGLHPSLADVLDIIMVSYNGQLSGSLNHLITGTPSKLPPGKETEIRDFLTYADTLIHDYLQAVCQWSSESYLKSTLEHIPEYEAIRTFFLLGFTLVMTLFYLVFIYPVAGMMKASVHSTYEMLMVIPTDVIKCMPTLQDFINSALSRE